MEPTPVPSTNDLTSQFATAYYDAAQAGAEMRSVANTLETLRELLGKSTEPFTIWSALDDQIGSVDVDRFMPALVKLRNGFQSALIAAQVAQLKQAFAEDRDNAWKEWLTTYLACFGNSRWRMAYAAAITQEALSYSPLPDWTVKRIQQTTQLICGTRWPESYDWFCFLADYELSPQHRAKFLAIAAEIQILRFYRLKKAEALLEKAIELAAKELQVRIAQGEYWTARADLERAREIFESLVREYPKCPEGYIGLGDCAEESGEAASAENCYYQAVLYAPGYSTGYERLISSLLRSDHQNQGSDPAKLTGFIQPLFLRAQALNETPALAFFSLGQAYRTIGNLKQARQYFQDGILASPPYTIWLGHAWLGYTDTDEAAQSGADPSTSSRLYDSAKEKFNNAIELAPEAMDGYWGLAWLSMQQKNWSEAEAWTNRCLQSHPEFESFVLLRRAEIRRQEGRLTEAEEDLSRSLTIESWSRAALDALNSLIDDYHTKGENEAARRLLKEWRRLSGPAKDYLYHNKIGNWNYEAGNYPLAAESYRLAIQAKDTDPVLHSNLALAIERLRVPGRRLQEIREATAELERANQLRPQPAYDDRLAAMRSEEVVLQAYGEPATGFDPVVVPIRVDIDWAVMSEILVPGTNDLLAETITAIQSVRARLKQEFGFTLPSVSFRDIQPAGTGKYNIIFNESTTCEGPVKAGSVISTILAHLEQAVRDHMAEFIGHDDVASLLKKSEEVGAQAIIQDTTQLTKFVGLLKKRLMDQQSIGLIDSIAADFVQMYGNNRAEDVVTQTPVSAVAGSDRKGFPQLTLSIAPFKDPGDQAALETELGSLQLSTFRDLGLAVPMISYRIDAALPEGNAVLLLNESALVRMENVEPRAIYDTIRKRAADLMVPELTEYYLARLKTRYPVLIRAVSSQLGVEKITIFLKSRLARALTIKNLPGLLENQLQEAASYNRLSSPVQT